MSNPGSRSTHRSAISASSASLSAVQSLVPTSNGMACSVLVQLLRLPASSSGDGMANVRLGSGVPTRIRDAETTGPLESCAVRRGGRVASPAGGATQATTSAGTQEHPQLAEEPPTAVHVEFAWQSQDGLAHMEEDGLVSGMLDEQLLEPADHGRR